MRMMRLRTRLADESGFTMAIALGVLTVTTLLMAAAFVAAKGDIGNSQHDLDGKRAYYAARAGLNTFLYKLNKNTEFWQTCPTQATISVPGSTGNQTYSYKPLPANGKTACSASDPVHTMIQLSGQGTGTFRMQFTGTSGTPAVSRTLVATFRRDSTLDYLYYSKYETLDPNTYANPANYAQCATLLRDGRSSTCGTISWITGDKINGPMYTQDQFAICGSPTFGRVGGTDTVESPVAPPTPVTYTNGSCSNGLTVNGQVIQNAPYIDPPPDNSKLLNYAQQDGKTFTGATYISISGNTALISNTAAGCNSGSPAGNCTINLDTYPIIYVSNGSGCSSTSYSPYNVSYADSTCGNAYVSGNYSSSVTIASANDIVISGNITTDLNGPAVMGLVANNFIRVMHGVTTRSGTTQGACGSAANVSSQTFPSLRVDAAVLALKHSFIVDNYDCGAPITGNLTINGAIAQIFRGTVGTTNNGNSISGYLKNYNYDDRLAAQQPPYLFDLASASWKVIRETGCVDGGPAGVAC